MQDILRFLKNVWPIKGLYCIALPVKTGGYAHHVFDTVEQAAKFCYDNRKSDVFFAVSSLRERKLWNPEKINKRTGEKGSYETRSAANALASRCLIADIDCGEGKPYPSQVEGLQALKEFGMLLGMPRPVTVSSGGGLHIYWRFTEDVAAADWKRITEKFKRIIRHFKLHADPTATSDLARVLRVVGTTNRKKNGSRPVELLCPDSSKLDFAKTEKMFDEVITEYNIAGFAEKVKLDQSIFGGVTTLADTVADKDQDLIVSRCNQMYRALKTDADVGYAMRCSVISICKCTKQNDYEHLFVNVQDEALARSQAESIETGTITANPHTCERFSDQFAEGCEGCKWKGKIKSPVSLGIVEPPKPKEAVEETVALPQELLEFRTEDAAETNLSQYDKPSWKRGTPRFKVPDGFRIENDRLYKIPHGDSEDLFPKTIVPAVFYPYDTVVDAKGDMTVTCYMKAGNSESQEVKIPLRMVASPSELAAELSSKGAIVTQKQAGDLVVYMQSYLEHINKQVMATEQHNQLGWHTSKQETPGLHTEIDPEKFVLPHAVITASGVRPAIPSKKLSHVSMNFGECGELEEWKKVANIYAQHGYEGYAFGALCGFGSPLMQFTEYDGVVVSMVGDSGSGKSTVLKIINSLFAKPNSYLTQSDTINAFFGVIGTHGCIAVTADELTDLPPERVSQIAYSISQGRDKLAMSVDRSIKENESTWKLMLVSSSNRSLLTKLAEYKKESSAEAYRVFEFSLNSSDHKLTKREAETMFSPLLRNYGHAGKIYIQYVLKNLQRVKQMIEDVRHEIDDRVNAIGPERYWTIAVSVNIVGGMIARELGLVEYDIDRIKNWACKQIEVLRGDTAENTRGSVGTLTAYLAESIGNTITLGGTGDKSKPFYCVKEPSQRVWNRYEIENGRMYIDRTKLRTFIVESGGDYQKVVSELMASGIIVAKEKLIVLTKGSNISNSGQVRTLVVNCGSEALAGTDVLLKAVA